MMTRTPLPEAPSALSTQHSALPPRRRLSIPAQLGPVIGLVGIFILFSILRNRSFPTIENLQNMLMMTAVVAMAALGMTIIIISGGIDLSPGSNIALSSVAIAILLKNDHSPLLSALGGVLVATLCGTLNGVLIGAAGAAAVHRDAGHVGRPARRRDRLGRQADRLHRPRDLARRPGAHPAARAQVDAPAAGRLVHALHGDPRCRRPALHPLRPARLRRRVQRADCPPVRRQRRPGRRSSSTPSAGSSPAWPPCSSSPRSPKAIRRRQTAWNWTSSPPSSSAGRACRAGKATSLPASSVRC